MTGQGISETQYNRFGAKGGTRPRMDIFVRYTYRSSAEQDALHAQSRTMPGATLTNAKGGQRRRNDTNKDQPGTAALTIMSLRSQPKSGLGHQASAWEPSRPVNQGLGLDWGGA